MIFTYDDALEEAERRNQKYVNKGFIPDVDFVEYTVDDVLKEWENDEAYLQRLFKP